VLVAAPVVCPDVAELLAVMALRKAVLSFVSLHLDCNVAEGRGRFIWTLPFWAR
jgi:hypothetical protein